MISGDNALFHLHEGFVGYCRYHYSDTGCAQVLQNSMVDMSCFLYN